MTQLEQAIMKLKRILLGVVVGMVVVLGGVWVLSRTLGNTGPALYHGETLDYWIAQVSAGDVNASNQANTILNAEIIPQLTDRMFHDTNDSRLRTNLVATLNGLPGVKYIYYTEAPERRAVAAARLGNFGPAARAAIPALIQAVQGGDKAVHSGAITALGKIHGEPDTIIPLLVKYLSDDDLDVPAALALANYGSLAQSAVPQIIPLLHAADDDDRDAAADALKKIDPVAYTNAMKMPAK